MILADSPFDWLVAIPAFIVAIGVLVAVHEFGHFWVARKLGIRVLRFSIGFGRPLWQHIGGKDRVEYVIAAIPLGGYVKLLDEREGNVPEAEADRAFNRQPVWKRIAVLLAGPAFNLIFAVLLYWVLFTAGIPAIKPIIGEVTPDSIAAQAGLRFEDQIIEVKGSRVATLEDATLGILEDLVDDGLIHLRVRAVDGGERTVVLDAQGRSKELTQPDALLSGLGIELWRPRIRAVVEEVMPGEPADKAGLKAGDEIVAFGGQPVADFSGLKSLVAPSGGRESEIEVKRAGESVVLKVTPRFGTENGRKVGLIGVKPVNGEPIRTGRSRDEMQTLQKYGVVPAIGQAAAKTWDTSLFTLRIVGRIITGDVSLKAISGPISIAETTGFAARQGWRVFLTMLALISISLGVLNLLPIPILDGGQVVYQLAELVKGGPVSERAQLLGQQIGIGMLILMMTLAFYNDIARHLN
jgi:regulator of sigma E protease